MSLRSIAHLGLLDRLSDVHRRMLDEGRGPVLLAFDADGTLWSGDVGLDGFGRLVRERGVTPAAGGALRDLAKIADVALREDANEQARLLVEAFEAGVLAPGPAFAMMAWAFAGRTASQMAAFARETVREGRLRERLHAPLSAVFDWARRSGVGSWVVSASPRALVEEGLREVGLSADAVVAMTPAEEDGILLPWVREPAPYAVGKVEALGALAREARVLAAFGDSAADLPMLALSRVPVAVEPQASLLAESARCPALVRLSLSP